MRKTLLLLASVCLLLTVTSACSSGKPVVRFSDAIVAQLDAEIERQMREQNLPGVVVAISVPGYGDYIAVKGKANLETRRTRVLDDPFRIASITKTFTATVILQLIDQGDLKKSDTLSKWFPNFPNADLITVEDLLRMRSGIEARGDENLLSYYYHDLLSDMTVRDIIRRAAIKGSHFTPPDSFRNSEGG